MCFCLFCVKVSFVSSSIGLGIDLLARLSLNESYFITLNVFVRDEEDGDFFRDDDDGDFFKDDDDGDFFRDKDEVDFFREDDEGDFFFGADGVYFFRQRDLAGDTRRFNNAERAAFEFDVRTFPSKEISG